MLNDKELKALCDAITDPSERFYKGVLYADFGKRKTTGSLRCSRKRAILLHSDRGWNAVLNHPDEFRLMDNVIPVEYQGLTQVKALVEAVINNQEPFNDVDLFVCDTISQMQENFIDFLVENFNIFGRESAKPKKMGKGLEEMQITGLPDYHLVRNKMRPVIELLVKAPIDVLFLAHVRIPNAMEIQKGLLAKRPNVTEAVFNVLARDATFIGYMEHTTKDGYSIDFEPKKTLVAKSQIATLTDKKIKTDQLPQFLWNWKDGV
jgi:hypothetical protein